MAAGVSKGWLGFPQLLSQPTEERTGWDVCVAEVALQAVLAFPCSVPLPGAVEGALPPRCAVHSPWLARLLSLAWWELAWLWQKAVLTLM